MFRSLSAQKIKINNKKTSTFSVKSNNQLGKKYIEKNFIPRIEQEKTWGGHKKCQIRKFGNKNIYPITIWKIEFLEDIGSRQNPNSVFF